MSRRFYLPEGWSAGEVRCTGQEARHLLRVMRFSVGDQLQLFDGRGRMASAELIADEGDTAVLRVLAEQTAGPAPVPLTLAVAFPKGDRAKWMIEKLTELGVQRCIPLVTQRTIVDPGAGKLEKLRQTIVEASKQCGRNELLELRDPVPWSRFWQTPPLPESLCVIADPGGETWSQVAWTAGRPLLCVIGPEGGLTPDEVEQAQAAGARRLSLGPRILRIETAAVAVASLALGCES